ncbi:FAD-linked oxidase [Intrasporangium oryzae NRRL B-24470]|uniref:FAD-linked oxidase n=1 Tax=Intrasporangium oryzae NRRL B-24470 TaxID=1386089 RepID=W9G7P1_9MICO|nr:FAD-binding oxidoreductase [Intrasporangium oryzae]EWT01297.1 FAD-linked oxidase [Intrasporangium oryzae NRRL B-24470]
MTIELTTTTRRAAGLAGLCDGAIHLPGDEGYDAVRLPWNVAVDQRPAAVAVPKTVAQVQSVVRAAAAAGLRVAPQSTGHNAGPLVAQGLDEVVVLRTSALRGVSIDPVKRIARVEGGALWLDATEPAADHGLAALHGSSPDVGIAGYSLGGGIGWYARKLGLATNSLTAIELVTADGELVRADATTNRELFWALRGGGGNFGVVTALEFRLYPIETAYAGMLVWDRDDAEKVLRRWADWAPDAPDSVSTSFRVLNLPPLPDIPEPFRGRSLAVIDGAVLGSDAEAESILGLLRGLEPELDTFGRVPARSLVRLHMDPEGPTPAVSDSSMLTELPDAAIDAFLEEVGPGSTSSLLAAEIRQLGGALGRPHEGGGALSMLDASFLTFGVAVAATPEMAMQGQLDAAQLMGALEPWATDRAYLNFAENAVSPKSAYDEPTWTQLKGLRSAFDPDDRFLANHRVPRLFEDGRVTE